MLIIIVESCVFKLSPVSHFQHILLDYVYNYQNVLPQGEPGKPGNNGEMGFPGSPVRSYAPCCSTALQL